MTDLIGPDGLRLIEWLRFAAAFATVLAATTLAFSTRRGLSYWPATSVLGLTIGMRALYAAILSFPPFAPFMTSLGGPLPQFCLQLLTLGGSGWALWLVWTQNRLEHSGTVDMDGNVHPVTRLQAQRQVRQAMVREGEVSRAMWERQSR